MSLILLENHPTDNTYKNNFPDHVLLESYENQV